MAKKIKWSPKAADSFEEICNIISKDSEYYAAIFAKKINSIIKHIALFSQTCRIFSEYQDENLREKLFHNYRIVYKIEEDFIGIVMISHNAKQLNREQENKSKKE